MIYRHAQHSDAEQIALLHAHSWRKTYRGLFDDDFLDKDAETNRLRVWQQRLSNNPRNQLVQVAENRGIISGFICAYGNEDETWGSLIDNLHIAPDFQRQGIGTQLMAEAFAWLKKNYPDDAIYLWVMARNIQARRFYEKLGAKNGGTIDKPNPVGGGSALNCRYAWPKNIPIKHLDQK